MYLKTEGLILRETEYKDSDKLLTVLTRDHGLMTLKARGVRSRSSRLKGACQLLAYSEFTYFDYRGFATINEAVPIDQFSELRKDLDALALASYFVQVAEAVSQEDAPSDDVLSLTLNALYALCRLNKPQKLIKAVFELRIACHAGYYPQLEACPVCGSDEANCFNVSLGTIQCAACSDAEHNGIRLPIGQGTLSAMRFICLQEKSKIFSFQVSESVLDELGAVCETYLVTQFERGFSALDFYKSLTSLL